MGSIVVIGMEGKLVISLEGTCLGIFHAIDDEFIVDSFLFAGVKVILTISRYIFGSNKSRLASVCLKEVSTCYSN